MAMEPVVQAVPSRWGRLHQVALAGWWVFGLSLPTSLFGMQLGVGLMAAGLLPALIASRLRYPRSALDGPIAVYLAAALISLALSDRPPTSFFSATSFWVMSSFFLCRLALASGARLRPLLQVLVILAVLAAVVGLAQALSGRYPGMDWLHPGMDPAKRLVPTTGRPSAVGFFFSRLTFAQVLLFPFLWSLALALEETGWKRRIGWATACLLIGAGLWATFSRAALVTALAGAGLVMVLGRRGIRRMALVLAVLVTTAALLLWSGGTRERLLGSFSGRTDWTRLTLWHTALDLAAQQPLSGIGYGNFKTAAEQPVQERTRQLGRSRFAGVLAWAHSNLLTLTAETGLLGAFAFCLIFTAYFRRLRLAWRQGPHVGFEAAFLRGSAAAVSAFLLSGLFHDNFFDGEVVFCLWFTLAASLWVGEAHPGESA